MPILDMTMTLVMIMTIIFGIMLTVGAHASKRKSNRLHRMMERNHDDLLEMSRRSDEKRKYEILRAREIFDGGHRNSYRGMKKGNRFYKKRVNGEIEYEIKYANKYEKKSNKVDVEPSQLTKICPNCEIRCMINDEQCFHCGHEW